MRQLFAYMGNKKYFLDSFLTILGGKKYNNFYEPFCGSAVLSFNTSDNFKNIHLNDLNRAVCEIYRVTKKYSGDHYKNILKEVTNRFGDIKANEKSYLSYRKWFNDNIFMNGDDEGLHLLILTNSCRSSKMRLSSKGFNQTWGNRLMDVSQDYYEIHEILQKTEITNGGWNDLVISENSLVFFDPPYLGAENDAYGKQWGEDSLDKLVNTLLSADFDWIYTDIENKINEKLQKRLKKNIIRKMKSNLFANIDDRYDDKYEVFYTNMSVKSNQLW